MAKKKPASQGMFALVDPQGPEEIVDRLDQILDHEEMLRDLAWLGDLQQSLQRFAHVTEATAKDAVELSGSQALWVANHLLADAAEEMPRAELIRWSFILGQVTEQIRLQETFDGMIGSARKVTRAAASNAKMKSPLNAKQWKTVISFVNSRAKGVSAAESYRQASAALLTGEFKTLPGVRVEIGPDAIKKQHTAKQ